MASLNENSKGIRFEHVGIRQSPFSGAKYVYRAILPEGMTEQDVLDVAIEHGYATDRSQAAWLQPHAYTDTDATGCKLVITYPYID